MNKGLQNTLRREYGSDNNFPKINFLKLAGISSVLDGAMSDDGVLTLPKELEDADIIHIAFHTDHFVLDMYYPKRELGEDGSRYYAYGDYNRLQNMLSEGGWSFYAVTGEKRVIDGIRYPGETHMYARVADSQTAEKWLRECEEG